MQRCITGSGKTTMALQVPFLIVYLGSNLAFRSAESELAISAASGILKGQRHVAEMIGGSPSLFAMMAYGSVGYASVFCW